MEYTKGEWEAGYNPGVTGPTTPAIVPFCGGKEWPYRTVNVGQETIAVVPAQTSTRQIGHRGTPILGSAEANAYLIASAPDLYEACKSAYAWYYEGQAGDYKIIGECLRQALAKVKGHI